MQGPSKISFAWTLFCAFFQCFRHVLEFGSKRSKQITNSYGNLQFGKCKFWKGSRNAILLGPRGPSVLFVDAAADAVEERKAEANRY